VSAVAYSLLTAANLVAGIGLLRRMRETLTFAIALQVFGIVNALVMLLPSVAARQLADAAAAIGETGTATATASMAHTALYGGVVLSVLSSVITLYFLIAARRRMHTN
jgi:hypothetical protein